MGGQEGGGGVRKVGAAVRGGGEIREEKPRTTTSGCLTKIPGVAASKSRGCN